MWDRVLSDGEVKALYEARANTSNPLYLEELNVAEMEELFQVHLDAGSSQSLIGDWLYVYSSDV